MIDGFDCCENNAQFSKQNHFNLGYTRTYVHLYINTHTLRLHNMMLNCSHDTNTSGRQADFRAVKKPLTFLRVSAAK